MSDQYIDKIVTDKRVEVAESIGILKGIELAKKFSKYRNQPQIFKHLNHRNITNLDLIELEQELNTIDSIICELGFLINEYESLRKFIQDGIDNNYNE